MNRLLTILLLLAATAHGQINNPVTASTATGRAVLTATDATAASTAVGLGATNAVTFGTLTAELLQVTDLEPIFTLVLPTMLASSGPMWP
jgi:hypothetical protein